MAKPTGVRQWDRWANEDPLFAILSDRRKQGNRWDVDEFMATGRAEVAEILADIRRLQLPVNMDRALDFGCGVGRLSYALAEHFREVDGIDGSLEYVRLARARNTQPDRIRFTASDLRLPFPDNRFDLVLSRLTLQHIPPAEQAGYLSEFVRVARPNGVLAFQALGFYVHRTLKGRIASTRLYQIVRGRPRTAIYPVRPERTQARIGQLGVVVREVRREADHHGTVASFSFIAQKPAMHPAN